VPNSHTPTDSPSTRPAAQPRDGLRSGEERVVLDDTAIRRALIRIAHEVLERNEGQNRLYLVAIPNGGVPLARQLAENLRGISGLELPVGILDTTLYRDDLRSVDRWPVLRGTEIPFSVDGAELVLVDDVLFTGRTVRAALNAICDLGRPERIRLAVLVDRGHRQLPIQPDVVGLHLPTALGDRVRVRLHPLDEAEEIVRVLTASGSAAPERRSAP